MLPAAGRARAPEQGWTEVFTEIAFWRSTARPLTPSLVAARRRVGELKNCEHPGVLATPPLTTLERSVHSSSLSLAGRVSSECACVRGSRALDRLPELMGPEGDRSERGK